MKKILFISLSIFIVAFFVSCELFPFFTSKNTHNQHFYDLAGDWEDDSYKTLKYREDGNTIMMSRGIGGRKLTETEATDLISKTEFSLKLDDVTIEPKADMTVEKLGFTGYHVVQYFKVIKMERGEHELYGKTLLRHPTNPITRENTVYLTIE